MSTTAPPSPDARNDRRFFGHPIALANLFGVELWERFSYYGMTGVMAYYLYYAITNDAQSGLGLPEATATGIVGAYGGLVYLSAVVGAWIADRLLGAERTLFGSAIVVMLGHIALAVLPGLVGVGVGLVLVALGSGGVKSSATSVVGSLYERNDPRADAGFSLFYMGVNIGAFAGPLLTGLTQKAAGFHWAFGLAAVGMFLGLAQYAIYRRNLPASSAVVPNPLPAGAWTRPAGYVVAAAVVVVVLILTSVITADRLATVVAVVVAVAAATIFAIMIRSPKTGDDERSRVWSYVPMWVANVVFWALFQQQFTVGTLYADKRTDRIVFGWEMPVSWPSSFEPLFVIILAPLFALLWTKLGDRGPTTPTKFAIGAGGMGLAFLLFLPFSGSTGNSTPVLYLGFIYLVFALAEMNLSPVGLSLSTRIGPSAFRNQMVALNYLNVSLGSALSGALAGFYSVDHEAAYFGITGGAAIVLAGVLLVLRPWIQRAMRGIR